ncbi:hypothetical protein Lal_00031501 [Lupinus albus]|uniref:Putative gamma interferon inducible lysosomal thiol reductase GILT n=1 Tax=Lupinus albus TaxID=3870 RepID=A0A6A4Q9G5_LUPAL|nr:putative gamma interferon inducible lysosomal thiol reductase GILT [Lupinus albus]KAF1876691.1 hypothetical protein Lal_00031501 [Lupinus albus]
MKMLPFLHSFPPRTFFFFIFCFILLPLLLLLLFLVAPSSSSQGEKIDRVTMSLYYESLCPYCADFIVNHLVRLFQTGLISIVNLRMIPWGNAWLSPDATIVCQHGDDECFLNTIQACAITIYPKEVQHFRFVRCLEQLTLENRHKEWVNCFQMTGLGTLPVNCYTSGNGKAIEQNYAKETAQLNPPHRFVPWVVVNNQALQEDYQSFVSYICRAYKGHSKPDACRSLSTRIYDSNKNNNSFQHVCYADGAKNLTYHTSHKIKE